MIIDLSLLGQREREILFCLSPDIRGVTVKELAVEIHGKATDTACDLVGRGLTALHKFLGKGLKYILRLDESEPEMGSGYRRKVRAFRLDHTAYVGVREAAKMYKVAV